MCPEVNEFRNVNTKRLKNTFAKQEWLYALFNLMRRLNAKNIVRKKNENPIIPVSHRTSSRILCGYLNLSTPSKVKEYSLKPPIPTPNNGL
jgi:hypothetical protein